MTIVLVTGGAGYVGSHACKALSQAGFIPVVYDNLCRGHADAVKWGPLQVGDITDREQLDRTFKEYKPIAVLHFAALAYVQESVRLPLLYYRNNVSGTATLLEAMITAGCKSIVFSSSCATYGIPRSNQLREKHGQEPINPYGRSKLMCEQMIADAEKAHEVRFMTLRYFNAAGADPDGEIGERHNPETHIIPVALQAAKDGIAVQVFGVDYPTLDGTCVRDYVHVSDLANAHVLALRRLLAGKPSTAYNLGVGQGYSVRQVIDAVKSVTGRPVEIEEMPRRKGDPAHLVADSAFAQRDLGWRPRWPDLVDQIGHAWRWNCQQASGLVS